MDLSQATAIARAICANHGWTLVAPAGQGAFKFAFRIQGPDGSDAALKVFAVPIVNERTERELDAMRRCMHRGIAKLYAFSTLTDGSATHVFSVEEFLPGGSLGSLLQAGGPIEPAAAKSMLAELVDALGHIAAQGLVHRDIKPDNIMFRTGPSDPVIVDFGLARALDLPALTPTWVTNGPGTPFYAPAEQLNNERELIDWRSDQFSLGVTLSVAVLGKHPYARDGEGHESTVVRVASRTGPDSGCIQALEACGLGVIGKMTQAWPIRRFRTPGELLSAVRG